MWGLYLYGQLMEKFYTAKEAHEAAIFAEEETGLPHEVREINEWCQIMEKCKICKNQIFQYEDGKWYMRIETGDWDYYYDRDEYMEIEIKYCYNCGKKYI